MALGRKGSLSWRCWVAPRHHKQEERWEEGDRSEDTVQGGRRGWYAGEGQDTWHAEMRPGLGAGAPGSGHGFTLLVVGSE